MAAKKSTFQFLIKQILITFDFKQLDSKFKLLWEKKSTLVLKKESITGVFVTRPKMDPIREKMSHLSHFILIFDDEISV